MKVTINWLKEFVDIDIPVDELAEKITMLGLEVEGITKTGISDDNKSNIFLTKIISVQDHTNAELLKICKVKGKSSNYKVITNSPNIEKGDYVVFAKPGTILPNGIEVKETKIKGETSEGLLLPMEFLNLETKSPDIWILGKDDKKAKKDFKTYTEEDHVLSIDLTANRSDCLSVIGIAREAAAMLDKELKLIPPNIEEDLDEEPVVEIIDKVHCPRYSARILRGVTIKQSPEWIKRRLELCGVRAINNVVDATNYTLLELGHPTHAFDLNRLKGGKVIARNAKKGEIITTLDGAEYKLDEKDLVIADNKAPVALAGVMGGENSEILDTSEDLLLESAFFNPESIRRTSKKFGIKTESSYRFERSADWGIPPTALDRVVEIIQLTANAKVSKMTDLYLNKFKDKVVGIDAGFVSSQLGVKLSLKEIENYLKRLRFPIMVKREDKIEVKIPSFRSDISRSIDLVEEIARIYGYNNIPNAIYKPPVDIIGLLKEKDIKFYLRNILQGRGFSEVYNYSFTNEEELKKFKAIEDSIIPLTNPLTKDATHLRNYLFTGLLKSVVYNYNSAYRNDLKFFEIGKVFHKDKKVYIEEAKIGFCIYGEEYGYYSILRIIEYMFRKLNIESIDIKKAGIDFLHPINSAILTKGEKEVGFLGEIHADVINSLELKYPVYIAEMDIERIDESVKITSSVKSIAKFPPTNRDLSLVVDENIFGRNILNRMSEFHEWIKYVEFIDLFKGHQIGENKKSLTYTLQFENPERTLNDEEVSGIINSLVIALKNEYGAELRS